MSNVLKFRTKEQRRILDVLGQLTDDEVLSNLSLLRSGCTMQYYRFGPPTLQITPNHIDLVLEVVEERGLVKNQPFMKGWDGLVVSDSFAGKLEVPDAPVFDMTFNPSFSVRHNVETWEWPLKGDRDDWIPKYTPLVLEDLRNEPKEEQSQFVETTEWWPPAR